MRGRYARVEVPTTRDDVRASLGASGVSSRARSAPSTLHASRLRDQNTVAGGGGEGRGQKRKRGGASARRQQQPGQTREEAAAAGVKRRGWHMARGEPR
jgi:hypothetical protein